MNKYIKKNESSIILDLGCGNGFQAIINAKKFKGIIGIDPDRLAIKQANAHLLLSKLENNVSFLNKTIEGMESYVEHFDGVISYCVLEHILNYEEVLHRAYNLLKPHGWLVISVDSLSTIRNLDLVNIHKTKHHVERYFKSNEIKSLLAKCGFVNIKITAGLKSRFSEKLFEKGIKNNFVFCKLIGILCAVLIFIFEYLTIRNNDGLIVIAKGDKA